MPAVRVYCPRPSDGARDLVAALRGKGVKALRLRRWAPKRTWRGVVVNWGAEAPEIRGEAWAGSGALDVLNPNPTRNKLEELHKLQLAGVPTVPFVPGAALPAGAGEWLPRSAHHQEGRDLVHPPARPDFWVRKLNIYREFRLHVFKDRVIRTGKKVPDGDGNEHPWIRSNLLGWKIDYGSGWRREMQQKYRDAAKAAINALGYDFGAVDLAVLEGPVPREFVVLEVNSAPGMTIGHTAEAYADHILALLE